MSWQQLQFQIPSADAEALEQVLIEGGALSVTLIDAEDQPVFQTEPGTTPLWDAVLMQGLFDSNCNLASLLELLKKHLPGHPDPKFEINPVEDQDWEKAWMDDFHPMQFGERLWICPHWLTPPQPEATNIMLDPGLAFGTGTHPTTAGCLEWLESNELTGKTLIDYGCGSGVLAIAAVLLGAKQVLAIDHDPQAIIATRSNRSNNGISDQQLVCCLPEDIPTQPSPAKADILLANILAGPLHQLAPAFAKLVTPGAPLLLSGILPEQSKDLRSRYDQWFMMDEPVIRDGWVRLCGSRRYSS
ncbi:MAG: 50S ribosomal protein L11 methyltransferase [Gammaproteobacteria bacterium]|nr:50S ribosomal protein L11 methyltransferase [Gammaproteobacteria bacterium]